MSLLPHEILVEIFSRLPQKSIGKCKCLSKSWLSFLSTPHFLKLCLAHNGNLLLITKSHSLRLLLSIPVINNDAVSRKLEFPTSSWTQVVGSCKGLVLLTNKKGELFIVNTFTSLVVKKIPDSDLALNKDDSDLSHGFGYYASTDDYKIVTISYDDDGTLAAMYSVKRGVWKRVVFQFNGFVPENYLKVRGFFVNGAIHWWCYPRSYPPPFFIVAFDLASEVFYEISRSLLFTSMCNKLVAREGRLCVVSSICRPGGGGIVWTIEEYGSVESWSGFVIPLNEDLPEMEPLCFVSEDGVVLRANDGGLFVYDVKEGMMKEFVVDGVPARCRDMGNFVYSVV